MKQAILITAHTSFNHIVNIINIFDHNYVFYIHIDKKSNISETQLQLFLSNPKVKFISQKFSINWGGTTYLKSILLLSEEALKDKEIEYIHLISGQDYPLKTPSHMSVFLRKEPEAQYIESFSLPSDKWHNGGMSRIQKYHLHDIFNARTYLGAKLIKKAIKFQNLFQLKRKYKDNLPPLYGGSSWWTLSYDCLAYVIAYTHNNPQLLKRFEYTLSSDEMYFQTVIATSPFSSKVVNNNLRYVDWTPRHGVSPVTLDERDYEKLLTSSAFFARKF